MKTRYILLLLPLLIGTAHSGPDPSGSPAGDHNSTIMKIHQKSFTLDSHTDTPFYFSQEGFDFSGRNGNPGFRNCLDLAKMQKGGLDAAFLAVFVGQSERNDSMYAVVRQRALNQFGSIQREVSRFPDLVRLALSPDEALRNQREDLRSIFIGIENGYAIGGDLGLISEYYRLGARYITLCHSKNNDICDSSTDEKGPEHNGLSEFGKDVVEEMNRLGILVDVSHASDKSFFDIIGTSRAPVIASHSACRALCDHPRNITDEMLVALADKGGVIQICFLSAYIKAEEPNPGRDSARAGWYRKYPDFGALSAAEKKTAEKDWEDIDDRFPSPLATVAEMVNHIDHAVRIAGIDHVGIGSDFDGGGRLEDCRDVSGMENVTRELVKRGYSDEDIRKIWGGNFMRVFREVIKTSHNLKKVSS